MDTPCSTTLHPTLRCICFRDTTELSKFISSQIVEVVTRHYPDTFVEKGNGVQSQCAASLNHAKQRQTSTTGQSSILYLAYRILTTNTSCIEQVLSRVKTLIIA